MSDIWAQVLLVAPFVLVAIVGIVLVIWAYLGVEEAKEQRRLDAEARNSDD